MLRALVALALAATLVAAQKDYSKTGPYKVKEMKSVKYVMPTSTDCAKTGTNLCDVTIYAYFPEVAGSSESFPLMVHANGFSTNANLYTKYAKHAASWGWVVVLWDMREGPLTAPTHRSRGLMQAHLNDWVLAANANPSSPLYNTVSSDHVIHTGHSLGGKSTALAAQVDPRITGYVLIDPVDCPPPFNRYGPDFPDIASTMNLTQAVGLHMGAQLGDTGERIPCAPKECNYEKYHKYHASEAWLIEIQGAGHTQFQDLSVPCLIDPCTCGTRRHSSVLDMMYTSSLAWMEYVAKGEDVSYWVNDWSQDKLRDGSLSKFDYRKP